MKSCSIVLNSQHYAPDFILSNPESYIEAVVANIKKDGSKEEMRAAKDLRSMFTPPWENPKFSVELDEAIIRYSNAINCKSDKYLNKYSSLAWINQTAPFMIAMASFDQINYGKEFIYPMMALLYGLYFDSTQNKYIKQTTIAKPGTNKNIDIGLFLKPEYSHISAIVFTCSLTLGKLTAVAISKGISTINQVYTLRENCSGQGHALSIAN